MKWFDERALAVEDDIVWMESITDLDYVRQSETTAGTRHRRPGYYLPGRMVGYSTVTANNGNPGCFSRRIFWLKDYDRADDPTGVYRTGCPSEAVDPRTVAPGVEGELTERALGPVSV